MRCALGGIKHGVEFLVEEESSQRDKTKETSIFFFVDVGEGIILKCIGSTDTTREPNILD